MVNYSQSNLSHDHKNSKGNLNGVNNLGFRLSSKYHNIARQNQRNECNEHERNEEAGFRAYD